jgi:WD40 repeat protein
VSSNIIFPYYFIFHLDLKSWQLVFFNVFNFYVTSALTFVLRALFVCPSSEAVMCMAWHPQQDVVACGTAFKWLRLYDIKRESSFFNDNFLFALFLELNLLKSINQSINQINQINQIKSSENTSPIMSLNASNKAITSVAFDPFNHFRIATTSDEALIRIWDTRNSRDPVSPSIPIWAPRNSFDLPDYNIFLYKIRNND